MVLQAHDRFSKGIACVAVLVTMLIAQNRAAGQVAQDTARPAQDAARSGANLVLVFPTGNRDTGNLLVEVAGPAEVPVGRSYDYQIRVTNITKNLVLEDVTIRQTKADGFSIEKSEPKSKGANKGESEGAKEGDDDAVRWSIARLAPGESKTISVTAMADKEGVGAGCLRASYQASLCLNTRFVKPEIQVTKEAPEKADLCDILTYRYTVKNTGSGAARGLKLRDELAQGLTTTDGNKAAAFDVGDLEPGQSREYTAKVQAAKPGDYSSRAVAEGANDLKAQSAKPSTAIRQAKLSVAITGPDAISIHQPMTYRAEVKNEGEAPARQARLRIEIDRGAKVIRMSRSSPGDADPRFEGSTVHWSLGTIDPGKEVDVSFTVVGHQEGEFKHTAIAESVCDRGGDFAKTATATANTQTQILTYPALLLELVDQTDPVRVGGTETYRVTVVNQGSGPDENVKVSLQAPNQFKFVTASGPGEAKADGQTVTLGPLDRLPPHERATWDVQFKPQDPGDVRMKATLTSEYLPEDRPAISIEPTRIVGSATGQSGENAGGGKSDTGQSQ